MKPVKFQIRSEVIRAAKLALLLFYVLVFVFFTIDALVLETGWGLLPKCVVAIGAIAGVVAGIRTFRYGSADHNHISLDDKGLIYTVWGHRRKWSWQELPTFKRTERSLLGRLFLGQPPIRFAVADAADWKARLGLRSTEKVSSGKLILLIGDIYESPLEEIAARLSEYRNQAHSGTSPGSA